MSNRLEVSMEEVAAVCQIFTAKGAVGMGVSQVDDTSKWGDKNRKGLS